MTDATGEDTKILRGASCRQGLSKQQAILHLSLPDRKADSAKKNYPKLVQVSTGSASSSICLYVFQFSISLGILIAEVASPNSHKTALPAFSEPERAGSATFMQDKPYQLVI